MLQIGAGTGLIFILRWFWWRINAFGEIASMTVSFVVACYFELVHDYIGLPVIAPWKKLIIGVGITTVSWLVVTLVTRQTEDKTLRSFYRLVRPGGPGWKSVLRKAELDGDIIEQSGKKWDLPTGIICMVLGCLAVYSALFSTGYWIYGNRLAAVILTVTAVVSAILLVKSWARLDIK